MTLLQILVLALVQGTAELLPVSSSAHVILAQKLMGLDPAHPQMTFLLVMLHTGTMFAVILYFWKRWKEILGFTPAGFSRERFKRLFWTVGVATACTGALGIAVKGFLEHVVLAGSGGEKGEFRELFRSLPWIGSALLGAGALIFVAGKFTQKNAALAADELTLRQAGVIGLTQGLCLPFRGFSRSGATISAGLLQRVPRMLAEEFSFLLAVVITPPVIAVEFLRLFKHASQQGLSVMDYGLAQGLIGMVFSFIAALGALRWLSAWLEKGRWHFFGVYCLAFGAVLLALGRSL